KDDTQNILVEVAGFNPAKIRKTAKRLGLHTEASHRFERGCDLTKTDTVAFRVASLSQTASKETGLKEPRVSGALVDFYPQQPKPARIALRLARCRQILGLASLDQKRAIETLEALQIKLIDRADERLLFEIPSWRADISREIDLIEEVG